MKGSRIKTLREEKGLKQEELAKILSIAPSTIGMYERNAREPNDDITLKLAEYFSVSTDYLLGKSDIRNPEELQNIRFTNASGLNVDDLGDDEIEEIIRQIEYMRWKKQNGNKK